jgi:hypothetical protein
MQFPILMVVITKTSWTFLILHKGKFIKLTIEDSPHNRDLIVETNGQNVLYAHETRYKIDDEHLLVVDRVELNPNALP